MNKFGRPAAQHQETSCFVHNLLEQQHNAGQWIPSEEAAAASRKADKNPDQPPDGQHHTQSRLLTKKQLSDMAFGIRELSKRLGHVRLNLKVKTVFLLTKAHDPTLIVHTRGVAEWLLDNKNAENVPYTV